MAVAPASPEESILRALPRRAAATPLPEQPLDADVELAREQPGEALEAVGRKAQAVAQCSVGTSPQELAAGGEAALDGRTIEPEQRGNLGRAETVHESSSANDAAAAAQLAAVKAGNF